MRAKFESIAALLLSAAVLLPCCVSAEAKNENKLNADNIEAVELVKGLGIFDENTDLSADISRAVFTDALYRISGMNFESDSAVRFFADVNSSTEYNASISAMYDMGNVRGYKGAFYPDRTVTEDEAAIIAVNVMRLNRAVSLYSDELAGYRAIAENIELFDGINTVSDRFTYLDTAKLIENILTTDLSMYANICGIDGYYMTAVLDMYMAEGILNDNGMTSIIDRTSVGAGNIKIGNMTMVNEKISVIDMLGMRVKAYFREVDGENVLISAVPDKRSSILVLDRNMIEEFKNFEYTYYENEESSRIKRARLDTEYDIVYNGTLADGTEEFKTEYMIPSQGSVTLINSDNDDKYDVLVIENFEVFVVSSYSENEQKLYSLNGKEPVDFKNADLYNITIAGGTTKLQIRNLAYYGYVLSVAASLDKKKYDIRLCSESVEGEIKRTDISNSTIEIDNEVYTVLTDVINSLGNSRYGKFYKNQYGELVYFEPEESAELIGFLMSCKILRESEEYDEETVLLKIYSEENMLVKMPAYEKIRIDGVKFQNNEAAALALENHVNTLIRFKTNKNNEITWIDTQELNKSEEDYKNSLNVLLTKNSNAGFCYDNFSWGSRYSSEIPADADSLVFVVKNDYADEKDIYCYRLYDFKEKFSLSSDSDLGFLTVYNTNQFSIIGTYALVRRENIDESYEQYDTNLFRTGGIVTGIAMTLNNENEPCYSVTVERGENKTELFFAENAMKFGDSGRYVFDDKNPYTLDVGDIVKWGTASDGKTVEAGGVQVIYDCDRDWSNSSSEGMSANRYSGRWHRLWLLDAEKDFMITVNEILSPVKDYADGKLKSLNRYVDYTKDETYVRTEICIFDKGKRRLYKAAAGDVKSYKNHGLNCSDIVGLYYQSGHRFMVIYK